MSNVPFTDPRPAPPPTPWPVGGGASGAALRALDWSQTLLGPLDRWPEALRAVVDLVLASAFPMVVLWGPELIQLFNDGYGEILGGRCSTAMGQPTRECWPEVWAFNQPVYEKVRGGETLRFENQLFPIARHGFLEQAYFTLCYSPLRQDGEVCGVLVTVFETTAKVEAEAQRREAEQDMLHMVESLPQVTWTADPEGRITGFSRRWLELTGMTSEQAMGHGWTRAPHPEDLPRMRGAWEHSIRTGEPYDTTSRIRTASGEYCWIRARALPSRDPRGAIAKWFGTIEEVDRHVKTLEALQNSEERLRLAQQAAALATWDWNLATGQLTWTGEYALLYGRPQEELDHIDRFFQYVHPDDAGPTLKATESATKGRGNYFHEFRVVWPDGSVRWLEGRGKPVFDAEGRPARVIGVNLDITQRKQAEVALLQSEKLAAVGRLASTIAHEINNPLESMTNLLYLLSTGQELTPESRNYLEMAEAELRRASHITAQTLRFHRQSTQPSEVDIGELLDSVVSLYGVRLRSSGIHVQRRYPTPVKLFCRDGDIRQVLNNLIGNAFDALRSGGKLLLRARPATDWTSGRPGVRITVADTGDGMSPETQKRLFDAFYTTKGNSGNGLGLWISKGIIDSHGGRIRLKSAHGQLRHGAVFSLFLPHAAPSLQESEAHLLASSLTTSSQGGSRNGTASRPDQVPIDS